MPTGVDREDTELGTPWQWPTDQGKLFFLPRLGKKPITPVLLLFFSSHRPSICTHAYGRKKNHSFYPPPIKLTPFQEFSLLTEISNSKTNSRSIFFFSLITSESFLPGLHLLLSVNLTTKVKPASFTRWLDQHIYSLILFSGFFSA